MPLNLSPTQIAFNARGDGKFNKPFPEQLTFFRQKLNLPSERYDDILAAAHDRAFMVAGAEKADLLSDLRHSVDRAVEEGKSIQWFRKEFNTIVERRGWAGFTGSDSKAGIDWRTRIIYKTNLSASYAAGRWKQLNDPDLLKSRPFWKYIHSDRVSHPRPLHVSWHSLVLRYDDPWWQVHFPPNGWGCECRITAVAQKDYQGEAAPNNGTYEKVDSKGQPHTLPKGIDFGWDYAPGSGTDTSLRELVQNKLINYQPAIARALSRDINNQIARSDSVIDFATQALEKASKEMFHLGFVENFAVLDNLLGGSNSLQGYLSLLPNQAVRHIEKSHAFDGGKQRPVVAEDYRVVQTLLNEADEIKKGKSTILENATIELRKTIDGERYRAIFEVFTGKKNRNLRLLSLVIKTR